MGRVHTLAAVVFSAAALVATLLWAQDGNMPPVLPQPDSPLSIMAWIERVGLPIVLVVILFYSGVRVARWTGVEVVKPLAGQGVSFIAAVAESNQQMASAHVEMLTTLREIKTSTAVTADAIGRMERLMERLERETKIK